VDNPMTPKNRSQIVVRRVKRLTCTYATLRNSW
jgi:hypothetical protein